MADRIEKSVVLRAPLDRVWRALTNSTEFGTWFGMKLDGPFVAGGTVGAVIEPTKVNDEVAKTQEPYKGMEFPLFIETIEPMKLFSYRWHPGEPDAALDYSQQPTTLVEFTLEEVAEGVRLTVTESGFDRISAERRAAAFESNEGGWTAVMTLIANYVHAG